MICYLSTSFIFGLDLQSSGHPGWYWMRRTTDGGVSHGSSKHLLVAPVPAF
jgi:hypothetical protein